MIKKQLISHEGLRLKPYRCSAGRLTIGVGRNLDSNGISEAEAMDMLDHDIDACLADLRVVFPDFSDYPEGIRHVLIDMRFQLGPQRFRGFRRMIAAVKARDWPEMVVQMQDSAWYCQVTDRAEDLIRMVHNCV